MPKNYSIIKNGPLAIVGLSLQTFTDQESVDSFQSEIFNDSSIKFVVLDLTYLQSVSTEHTATFTKIQKMIRDKERRLSLFGLEEGIKYKLIKLGIIRSNELASSLKEAVTLFTQNNIYLPETTRRNS